MLGTKAVTRCISSTKTLQFSYTKSANLVFSVKHVFLYLQNKSLLKRCTIDVQAAVYLTGVLEYIAAEIMELSGNAAKQEGAKIIVPRHVMLAICTDDELNCLFSGTIYVSSGVVPNINQNLIEHPTISTCDD